MNAANNTATAVTSVSAGPVVATTNLPPAAPGVSYSQILTGAGGTAPYSWSIVAGALPPGLSLSNGGVISGTPTTASTFNFTVRITDATAAFSDKPLSILVSATDVTPPSLESFSFSPTTIDTAGGPATVTVTMQVADSQSGIVQNYPAFLDVSFKSPSGAQRRVMFGGGGATPPFTLISGTQQNGTWQGTLTFPQFSEIGTWVVELVHLVDGVGNSANFGAAGLQARGFPTQLFNAATVDDRTPPTLVDFSFSPTTIDTSAGTATVTVTMRATDSQNRVCVALSDPPCSGFIANSQLRFHHPGTGQSRHGIFVLASGTLNDGTFQAQVIFPQNSAGGTWKVGGFILTDNIGNRVDISTADLAARGFPTDVTNVATVDDHTPPALAGLTFTPTTVDTSAGAAGVTVTLQVTDDLSGVGNIPQAQQFGSVIFSFMQVDFRSPSGGQRQRLVGFGQFNLISGTFQNGTWQGTLTFPQFSEAGTWKVDDVNFTDAVGNHASLNNAILRSLGFNSELVVVTPSLVVDGTVSAPQDETTVTDDVFGARAQVVVPAGVLSTPTTVAIDVFQSPLDIPTPSGFSAPGTRFVNINLDPKPAMPLPAPGLTVVLPLANPMTPGTTLDLFRVDPATGNLVPALDVNGNPVRGTVNADGLSATFNGVATLSIVVGLIPIAPVANAGPDQTVNEGTTVTLDGSASTGQDLSFQWVQLAGPPVVLTGATTATPSFTAPLLAGGFGSQVLTFQLTVTRGNLSSSDTVDVAVVNVNHAAVASAGGNQVVKEGSPVTLSGINSFDPDGDPIAFQWTQVSGSPVTLNGADTAQATFTAPLLAGGIGGSVTLRFALTVSDGALTGTDEVTVTVEQENHAPTANAGTDQTVNSGTVVALDGSGSNDPDNDQLFFLWTQVGGPSVQLVNDTTASPSFTAPAVTGPTMLTFRLVVNDTLAGSVPDDVVITVVRPNDPPLCGLARAVPESLWPPNHKLIPVKIAGVTDPNNDAVQITIIGVTQDEPVNGLGDGDTSPDAVIQGDKVLLRAERSGTSNGRVYEVHFTADDGQGGTCSGSVKVGVPHSMKPGMSAVDDGQLYDSTQP